jgi:hypothetical protein
VCKKDIDVCSVIHIRLEFDVENIVDLYPRKEMKRKQRKRRRRRRRRKRRRNRRKMEDGSQSKFPPC